MSLEDSGRSRGILRDKTVAGIQAFLSHYDDKIAVSVSKLVFTLRNAPHGRLTLGRQSRGNLERSFVAYHLYLSY